MGYVAEVIQHIFIMTFVSFTVRSTHALHLVTKFSYIPDKNVTDMNPEIHFIINGFNLHIVGASVYNKTNVEGLLPRLLPHLLFAGRYLITKLYILFTKRSKNENYLKEISIF